MNVDWRTLTGLLGHIQANLEGDIGLDRLARKAGLSPFHLQRTFKAAIGETARRMYCVCGWSVARFESCCMIPG